MTRRIRARPGPNATDGWRAVEEWAHILYGGAETLQYRWAVGQAHRLDLDDARAVYDMGPMPGHRKSTGFNRRATLIRLWFRGNGREAELDNREWWEYPLV